MAEISLNSLNVIIRILKTWLCHVLKWSNLTQYFMKLELLLAEERADFSHFIYCHLLQFHDDFERRKYFSHRYLMETMTQMAVGNLKSSVDLNFLTSWCLLPI